MGEINDVEPRKGTPPIVMDKYRGQMIRLLTDMKKVLGADGLVDLVSEVVGTEAIESLKGKQKYQITRMVVSEIKDQVSLGNLCEDLVYGALEVIDLYLYQKIVELSHAQDVVRYWDRGGIENEK